MENNNIRKKGIRVGKGESTMEAMKDAIPHWIHDKREDPSSVTGFIYLPGCTCSSCGYHSNMEKPVCPHCGARMSREKGIY